MVKEAVESEYDKIYSFIRQDNARNYFIRLGLDSSKPIFERIFAEWDEAGRLRAVLFKRLSGNLQFYASGDFDIKGFAERISQLDFSAMISPSSYSDKLLEKGVFSSFKDGAFIAKLSREKENSFEQYAEVEPLKEEDLDEVVRLYTQVFTSYSSKELMLQRLRSGRGRGVCIREKGAIACVVQSEFEEADSAIIVGVGTLPVYQGNGLATKCLKVLCSQLLEEGKDLYLQFDNKDAGRIYQKLGFEIIDQVRHYKR